MTFQLLGGWYGWYGLHMDLKTGSENNVLGIQLECKVPACQGTYSIALG